MRRHITIKGKEVPDRDLKAANYEGTKGCVVQRRYEYRSNKQNVTFSGQFGYDTVHLTIKRGSKLSSLGYLKDTAKQHMLITFNVQKFGVCGLTLPVHIN